ncbi:MAG: hypothetical protein IH798_02715 [Gemmatimonadetes bacterium]|nr:hypothetical protein [Gemmatimonadota bacterium]
MDRCEENIQIWQASEPRVWGRLMKGVYRLVDWKPLFVRIPHALATADRAAEASLNAGIDRWEAEGRLSHSESAELRSHLSTGEAKEPIHHLGVQSPGPYVWMPLARNPCRELHPGKGACPVVRYRPLRLAPDVGAPDEWVEDRPASHTAPRADHGVLRQWAHSADRQELSKQAVQAAQTPGRDRSSGGRWLDSPGLTCGGRQDAPPEFLAGTICTRGRHTKTINISTTGMMTTT